MGIKTQIYPKGPLSENTYLITDEATGFQAVVDPGYIGQDLISSITGKESLKYILLTHGHYDHYAAAQAYINAYPDAVFAVPAAEKYLLGGGRDNKWIAFNEHCTEYGCPPAQLELSEGDKIMLGETELSVIATPGHTEGGICFSTGVEAFTGDTLFRLSVGNTSLETGDWNTMVDSIRNKLYTLPDELIIYPGHGAATTIGYEKRANPFV